MRGGRFQAGNTLCIFKLKTTGIPIEVSDFLNISYGVPQGLVLGSILFSIFVNDLGEIYMEYNCMQIMLYYSHVIQRSYG